MAYVERRLIDFAVRRIDQTEMSQTIDGRGRPRKIINVLLIFWKLCQCVTYNTWYKDHLGVKFVSLESRQFFFTS